MPASGLSHLDVPFSGKAHPHHVRDAAASPNTVTSRRRSRPRAAPASSPVSACIKHSEAGNRHRNHGRRHTAHADGHRGLTTPRLTRASRYEFETPCEPRAIAQKLSWLPCVAPTSWLRLDDEKASKSSCGPVLSREAPPLRFREEFWSLRGFRSGTRERHSGPDRSSVGRSPLDGSRR